MTKKEKVLGFMKHQMKMPMTADEIALMLNVPKTDTADFLHIIDTLEQEGAIIKTKKKRYAPGALLGFITGKYIGNERGFGFVECEEDDDVFVSAEKSRGALHGDVVMIKILSPQNSGKRKEGKVVKIVSPVEHKIVGRFSENGNQCVVVPILRNYAKDIHIAQKYKGEAKDGDMVTAQVVKRGNATKNPEGRILSVIGNIHTPGVDILSVIESRNIPYEFSEEVLDAAKRAAKKISPKDLEKRLDLRQEQIITIDGDDAKDLDDAVHVKKLQNGHFELGVHIADVGHYVPYKGVIDREAFRRGTSIYLADRVIPMLPEVLSNGICSLNEGVDRLTLSVIMEIDQNGAVQNHNIYESVIHSSKRMTYTNVTAIVEGNKEKRTQFSDLVCMIDNMAELRTILRKKRVARGSIDFHFDEARIVLDAEGKPVDIVKREHGVANSIIEEFMLVCNETVAEHMFWRNIPFIYRVHEEPEPDAIKEFAAFIAPLGYRIKHAHGKIHPKELAKLIDSLSGKREELMISSAALRSLMKARYSSENLGHFGLAAAYYCHFTSPIRRYPDLAIHRIIKDCLHDRLNVKKMTAFTAEAAKQSSDRELEAVDAERAVEDMKKAEFMQERVGDTFEALITGVTQFGMFAALENTIEGLIRLADLQDDYYLYDESTRSVCGERSGKTYRIGDKINVCVARADALTGKIDFVPEVENRKRTSRRKTAVRQMRQRERHRNKSSMQTAKFLKKKRKKR